MTNYRGWTFLYVTARSGEMSEGHGHEDVVIEKWHPGVIPECPCMKMWAPRVSTPNPRWQSVPATTMPVPGIPGPLRPLNDPPVRNITCSCTYVTIGDRRRHLVDKRWDLGGISGRVNRHRRWLGAGSPNHYLCSTTPAPWWLLNCKQIAEPQQS